MPNNQPITELDTRYSSADATARPWSEAMAILEQAEIYWVTTIRTESRPHVTPLIAVWLDGALYFSTGAGEQKARNLAANANCVLTTGCNAMERGLDVVIEGVAERVRDRKLLQQVAGAYKSKYGWDYIVTAEGFEGEQGNVAQVYAVRPTVGFGFGKGEPFSQTRWRFRDRKQL